MPAANVMPKRTLRVLIVEDEQRLRDLLLDVLPQMGYPASAARSGEEAFRIMENSAHDLVLLDLQLPGIGGMDFFERLKDRWPKTQVIVLTGFGDLESAKKAIHLDVVDFLSKPCPLGQVEQALERARRRLHGYEQFPQSQETAEPPDPSQPAKLSEVEQQQILAALDRNNGNRTATAVELGISRRTLHYRLQEYRRAGLLGLFGLMLAFACATSRADITVDASGKGDFKSVQAAVDSVPAGNASQVKILIKPGSYEELIKIPQNKPFISFVGTGAKPQEVVLTYHLKASDPKPDGSGQVGTSGTPSVLVSGHDFSARNVTFVNSAGHGVGQAVALKTQADRAVFYDCRFLAYQDTLYLTAGRSYLKDCYIAGDTDFIFGNGTAVFDHCTINSRIGSYITAANTTPQQPFGFVFLDCSLVADESVQPQSAWLGRPWQWDRGSSASVTFIRTKMGSHIKAEGWHPWDAKNNTQPEKNTRYGESGSMDLNGKPMDISKRVTWSHQLSNEQAQAITVEKVLTGQDQWQPTKP